jgi:hypothetical protein
MRMRSSHQLRRTLLALPLASALAAVALASSAAGKPDGPRGRSIRVDPQGANTGGITLTLFPA